MVYNSFVLKIVGAPNPVLSQSAKIISKVDTKILKLIGEMSQTLLSAKDPVGVGLAASQVGRCLQIFITKPTAKSPIQVFINPKIIQKTKVSHLTIDSGRCMQLNDFSSEKSQGNKLEGCLSLPSIWGHVKRESEISISYLDQKGASHTKQFKGFLSTIIQHEMDHLNGILFPKRVLEQKGQLYKSQKNEKDEDVFEEIDI